MIYKKLDARGLQCPLPILRTHKAMRGVSVGDVLIVLTTDPGSVDDFVAFCDSEGHALLDKKIHQDYFQFTIQCKK
ncbi:MAG: Sulfur carrier protein TusA [Hyphomicrobiaceae bacterium hypho_1]